MRSNYVRGASISCSASQAEIRTMLTESGARGVHYGSERGKAAVAFSSGNRQFRFVLRLPGSDDSPPDPAHDPPAAEGTAHESKTAQELARRRWRQLSVLIRAKLDAVGSGIVTFDEEFLAYMVMPGGSTVFQVAAPGIATAYAAGSLHEQDWRVSPTAKTNSHTLGVAIRGGQG